MLSNENIDRLDLEAYVLSQSDIYRRKRPIETLRQGKKGQPNVRRHRCP